MIINRKKEIVPKDFVFECNGIKYNVDVQKLKEVLCFLGIEFEEGDFLKSKNLKTFLKKHHLLIEEFIEFVSKS